MTVQFPDLTKKEDILKLNPYLRTVPEFQGLNSDEICFVVLMADAMSPFRFNKTEEEKINNIIDIIPAVKSGLNQSLQKKFKNWKKHYLNAVTAYINKFSSKSDHRALKGRDALINTYEQFCELYSNLNLVSESMDKMDKDTLDNIKQISTMVKQGTITDLAEQIEKIERRLSFVVDIKGETAFTGDPEDMIGSI